MIAMQSQFFVLDDILGVAERWVAIGLAAGVVDSTSPVSCGFERN